MQSAATIKYLVDMILVPRKLPVAAAANVPSQFQMYTINILPH
jgi:hypothetical protein